MGILWMLLDLKEEVAYPSQFYNMGFKRISCKKEDRNNEYTSCHFFNFYFEPTIQSGGMIVTDTVKILFTKNVVHVMP